MRPTSRSTFRKFPKTIPPAQRCQSPAPRNHEQPRPVDHTDSMTPHHAFAADSCRWPFSRVLPGADQTAGRAQALSPRGPRLRLQILRPAATVISDAGRKAHVAHFKSSGFSHRFLNKIQTSYHGPQNPHRT